MENKTNVQKFEFNLVKVPDLINNTTVNISSHTIQEKYQMLQLPNYYISKVLDIDTDVGFEDKVYYGNIKDLYYEIIKKSEDATTTERVDKDSVFFELIHTLLETFIDLHNSQTSFFWEFQYCYKDYYIFDCKLKKRSKDDNFELTVQFNRDLVSQDTFESFVKESFSIGVKSIEKSKALNNIKKSLESFSNEDQMNLLQSYLKNLKLQNKSEI